MISCFVDMENYHCDECPYAEGLSCKGTRMLEDFTKLMEKYESMEGTVCPNCGAYVQVGER